MTRIVPCDKWQRTYSIKQCAVKIVRLNWHTELTRRTHTNKIQMCVLANEISNGCLFFFSKKNLDQALRYIHMLLSLPSCTTTEKESAQIRFNVADVWNRICIVYICTIWSIFMIGMYDTFRHMHTFSAPYSMYKERMVKNNNTRNTLNHNEYALSSLLCVCYVHLTTEFHH